MSRSAPLALAASLATLAVATPAAADDLIIAEGTQTSLDGEVVAGEVDVAGTLTVRPFDGTGGGWLRILADRIVVRATGRIDADGQGYRDDAPGPGVGASLDEANNPDNPIPGGGGSHIGAGANGLRGADNMLCAPFPGNECDVVNAAVGGALYDDPSAPLALLEPIQGMGSAGGHSWPGCPDAGQMAFNGGPGGGVIILQALELQIDGVVSASGATPTGDQTRGRGGGAGGTLILSAANSFVTGNTARIVAAGAPGSANNSIGGGGGGGLIVLATDSDVSALLASDCPGIGAACTDVSGATTLPCMVPAEAGAKVTSAPLACPDADGDGHDNAGCGGDDCDDADPATNPDAEELCDGTDNDCDTLTDDDDGNLCGEGSDDVCVEGVCQPPSEGEGGSAVGPSPTPDPPRLELGGGLCAATAPLAAPKTGQNSDSNRGLGGPLGLLFGAAAMAWRRRRRTKP